MDDIYQLIAERTDMQKIDPKLFTHLELRAFAVDFRGHYTQLEGHLHEPKPQLFTLYAVSDYREKPLKDYDMGRSIKITFEAACVDGLKESKKLGLPFVPKYLIR